MMFKVGDRVKILQKATSVGVEQEDVGKVGVISRVGLSVSNRDNLSVQMQEICVTRRLIPNWSVGSNMVELFPKKNQQLLFKFME